MKKCILYLVSLALVLALMSASAQAVSVTGDMTHKYNFNVTGGTPTGWEDAVDAAPGTGMGGAALGPVNIGGTWYKQLITSANGDYMSMPGPVIAVNTYDQLTMELFSIQHFDQGYSMTAALGDTDTTDWGWGQQYVAISTTRGDNVTRSMMTDGSATPGYLSEVGENGPELNDEIMHHYVLTVGPLACCFNQDVITLYIDGVLQGAHIIENRSLSLLSNNLAYLAKSTYAGDATFIGEIVEFNIYNTALDCNRVLANFIEGPDPMPEPATMVLLGLGSLALLRRRKS